MKIYIHTDTHFFHDAMVKYCGRPQDHTLIIGHRLLNMGLTKEDLLIHLGDICIGHDEEAHQQYIMPLVCKKWLLRGNHDHKSNSWYLEHGWDFVGEQVKGTFLGKRIVFSHIPVKFDDWYDFNIHGHFHNDTHRSHEPGLLAIKDERQKLLSIEGTDFRPVLLDTFLKKAQKDTGRPI